MDEEKLVFLLGSYEREKRNLSDSILQTRFTLREMESRVANTCLKLQILESINRRTKEAIDNEISDVIIRTNLRNILSRDTVYQMLRNVDLLDLNVQDADDFMLSDPINNCEIARGYDTIITFKV